MCAFVFPVLMNTDSRSILKFMLRCVSVIAPVILLLLAWYVLADPFKVLRHYDDYFPDPRLHKVRIGINKGLVTLTNFNDRLSEGRNYDSFIFGSSISCYYDARRWATIVEATSGDTLHPYHFDSSSETLMSMARKTDYLDRQGIGIRHALIVLDPIIMGADESDGPAYLDPPQLHDSFFETLKYHYTFFRAATNADFFKSYLPAGLRGKPSENGRNLLFERQPIIYDKITNQETIPQWDSLIRTDSRRFYLEHPLKEPPDHLSESFPVLNEERIKALERIKEVFDCHRTDYRIIIGPNRAKVTLNSQDLQVIWRIFSRDRVYDFSRSLAGMLEQDTMLYDNTHYRPPMAELLMRMAYEDEDSVRALRRSR